jgi:hypothetical protein
MKQVQKQILVLMDVLMMFLNKAIKINIMLPHQLMYHKERLEV